jgi:hypothetical protein
MKYQSEENELLYRLCYYTYIPTPNDFMFTSKTIMHLQAAEFDELRITRYKARKYLRSWEAQGLIIKSHIGCQDEDGYVHCYHGYEVTGKLLNTAIGQRAKSDCDEMIDRQMRETYERGE